MLSIKWVSATHIVGGEIYYDKLSGNNYKIHMKMYRDCLNGIPPLDNPAFVTIFNASGGVYTTLNIALLSQSNVPPTNNSPCAPTSAGNACVQEGIYEAIVNLPPATGGYYIVYQRCCRNATILNLTSPGSVGTTYWEHIPGPEMVANNSSPRFTNRPPIYICQNLSISFDHSATDPDGDSLVYSLCTPFNGLSTTCPLIDGTGSGGNCPFTNTAPPYFSVPFTPPYSASYPMASSPAININASSGFLNGKPTIQGQWVVGVCVSEYRAGVLIGTHHRDFQFNVIACPFVVEAGILGQTTTNNGQGTGYCNGFTVSFQNNSSSNSTTYFWDFGDPSTTTDTSSAYNPSYTFPLPGDYTVSLTVNPGTACSDDTFHVFHIHPLLLPDFVQPTSQCFNGNSFNFVGAGIFQGNGTFNWNFGLAATPQTANTAAVNNVVYSSPGIYVVNFTVNENGCSATASKNIEVLPSPVASLGNFSVTGCSPLTVTFPNLSTTGSNITFEWLFSDGTTSTLQNPVHTFSIPGVYSVTLSAISSQVCIDTSQVSAVNSVTVLPTPSAAFNSTAGTKAPCFDGNSFNFISTGPAMNIGGTLTWNFGNSASILTASTKTVNNISYNAPGTYTVSLVATENGCSDTKTQVIDIYQNPTIAIADYPTKGCDPQLITFINLSTAASPITYSWIFSDGTTSSQQSPSHIFTPPGVYNFTLTISTSQKCLDTAQITSVNSITISPSPVAGFTATPMVTSIFEPDINFFASASPDVIHWNYNFGDGSSSTDINPFHTYAAWGDYTVYQTVTNEFGCPNTAKLLIRILPEFRFWVPNAFTPGLKDDLNDVFKPVVMGVENYSFFIFNRWGELIFKTTDTEIGWDGGFKGKDSPMDVYIWKCEFKNIVSKEPEYHIGHVTIVR